ncbi:hypothetical protein JYT44_00400 [Caldithrix abyssi]|nr:hypothetical protein [Caldithrix abyssi]
MMKHFRATYLMIITLILFLAFSCTRMNKDHQVAEKVLEFPQEGLDDLTIYQGYITRFFRDINKNTVQVYVKQDVGRIVNVWANGFNESIGFTARGLDGKPAPISWGSNQAETFKDGKEIFIKYALSVDSPDIILGHFYMGTMRQERDLQYFKKQLEPFGTTRYIDNQFGMMIDNIEQLSLKYKTDYLKVLGVINLDELRKRLVPDVSIQKTGKQQNILVSQTSFDGKNDLSIQLSFHGQTKLAVQGDSIIISAVNNQQISFEVTISSDAPSLHPITRDRLFNQSFFEYFQTVSQSTDIKRTQKLERQIKGLELLSSEEKLMASSPNYATYFGRDMMMSALMMGPILQPEVNEFVINSVLKKLTADGEVSHEEGLGGQAIRENVHKYNQIVQSYFTGGGQDKSKLGEAQDVLEGLNQTTENYLMVDDDFQLPVLLGRYLSDPNVSDDQKKTFLLGKIDDQNPDTRINAIIKNLLYVNKKTKDYILEPSIKNLISFNQREDGRWHSGSWRDSGAGYANGRYAMDINAIWVPKALEAVDIILSKLKVFHISFDSLSKQLPELETSELKNYYHHPDALQNAIMAWQDVKGYFKVKLDGEEALRRIREKLSWLSQDEAFYWREILNNTEMPETIEFYAIALDENGKPIPVMHSDIATLFFLNEFTEDILLGKTSSDEAINLLNHFILPFPLGLFIDGVGSVVTNDMYASKTVWENFNKDLYHSPRTIWGREVNLLIIGITKQILAAYDETGQLRDAGLTAYVKELKQILNTTLKAVETSGLKDSELWSYEVQEGKVNPVRYGTSSDIQLWNLTNMAAQYLLYQF